jgi:hypothetical protein
MKNDNQEPITQNTTNKNIEDTLNLILGTSLPIQQENEIQQWIEEPQCILSVNDKSIIRQYFENRPQYQFIPKLYRIYCHCPASSTSVERLWSAAGNILDRKRCSLSPQVMSEQLFIKYNNWV